MSKNPSLSDVRARRAEIAKEIGTLQAEDAELATAERVLLRLLGGEKPMASPLAPSAKSPELPLAASSQPETKADAEVDDRTVDAIVKEVMTGRETLEELIVLMMEYCADDWWTANEIQACATEIKGKEVPMSSVSPTLTNMKNNGLLVRDGLKVGLAARHPKQTAAE